MTQGDKIVKSNSIVRTEWEGGVLTVDVLGAGSFTFDKTLCSDAVRVYAEEHGFTQRIVDRAAKGRDPKTGKSASPQEKFTAMKELADFYMLGGSEWSMTRSGSGREGGLFFEALCELRPDKTSEKIKAYIAKLTEENPKQLATLRGSKEIVAIMNRLRAERAEEVDVENELAGLDEMDDDSAE